MANKKNTKPAANPEGAIGPVGATVVTVALNHPHGIRFSLPNGTSVLVRGNADNLRGKEKGIIPVGRYGYTRLPVEHWEAVVKIYGEMPLFKNGLIFAEGSVNRAEDRADEQVETRHGREPVSAVETMTEEIMQEV